MRVVRNAARTHTHTHTYIDARTIDYAACQLLFLDTRSEDWTEDVRGRGVGRDFFSRWVCVRQVHCTPMSRHLRW